MSVQYKRLITDVNENRKYGVWFNVAAQNLKQCKKKYGEEDMSNLLTGFGTKIWFNPKENDSAKHLSTALGNEIKRKTNYTYGTSGEKENTSRSTSESKKELFSVAQILKLPQKWAIVQSQGVSSNTEENIPWKVKFKPSPEYMGMTKWAKGEWEYTREQLIARSPQLPADGILAATRFAAEAFLPLRQPPDAQETVRTMA
ncbi:MAG: type IV secretory system conjugative DNA transfer family protein [Acaryochloridaceae cyanobacterium RU_4_10]|nr:type IV secretory system conjugative DNA transfer family protein [Acaryochloridaceae cyanobacterium RU_4_10]